MKKICVIAVLLLSAKAQADFSSTVTVASNYIWRGLSFSSTGAPEAAKGAPIIQGSMDYAHSSGWALNTFVGNSDSYNFDTTSFEKDTEAELDLTYSYKISDDVTAGLAFYWFNYLVNPSNNSVDYEAYISWKFLRFDASYMPNYFGTESTDTYFKLGLRQNVTEKFGVLAHIGASHFGDDKKVGFKDYVDHRVGLFYSAAPYTIETAYTNTDRKDLNDVKQKDQAVTLSIAVTL